MDARVVACFGSASSRAGLDGLSRLGSMPRLSVSTVSQDLQDADAEKLVTGASASCAYAGCCVVRRASCVVRRASCVVRRAG